jgi:hypothetical protein
VSKIAAIVEASTASNIAETPTSEPFGESIIVPDIQGPHDPLRYSLLQGVAPSRSARHGSTLTRSGVDDALRRTCM